MILSIQHDSYSRVLTVRFDSGKLYRYLEVPEHIYHSVMQSPSLGKGMHRYVLGKFKHVEVKR